MIADYIMSVTAKILADLFTLLPFLTLPAMVGAGADVAAFMVPALRGMDKLVPLHETVQGLVVVFGLRLAVIPWQAGRFLFAHMPLIGKGD